MTAWLASTSGGADTERAVRSCYRMVDTGDVEGLLDVFAADPVYDRPGYAPILAREALRRRASYFFVPAV